VLASKSTKVVCPPPERWQLMLGALLFMCSSWAQPFVCEAMIASLVKLPRPLVRECTQLALSGMVACHWLKALNTRKARLERRIEMESDFKSLDKEYWIRSLSLFPIKRKHRPSRELLRHQAYRSAMHHDSATTMRRVKGRKYLYLKPFRTEVSIVRSPHVSRGCLRSQFDLPI
jgi:hypothetical protein